MTSCQTLFSRRDGVEGYGAGKHGADRGGGKREKRRGGALMWKGTVWRTVVYGFWQGVCLVWVRPTRVADGGGCEEGGRDEVEVYRRWDVWMWKRSVLASRLYL